VLFSTGGGELAVGPGVGLLIVEALHWLLAHAARKCQGDRVVAMGVFCFHFLLSPKTVGAVCQLFAGN